jgi:hypothetical protein
VNPFKFILGALRWAGVFGLYLDGGGGGGAPEKQTQVADLPDWAKPYAQETLAKGQALTNVNQNPYQTYQGQRIAGFSPLQEQAFQGVGNLQPSSQLGAATGITGAASLGALGTQYRPFQMGQFTSDRAAQYMNPFVEQAMEPQLREAARASDIQRNMEQAKAVGAGAFGGSRQAIVEAERQRNLGQLQGDIRAKGYMSAFDQAQQNFAREQQMREQSRQYGAGLGMQGLQTALQGAGQLGNLGQQQFGQQKDVLGLQSQFGAQQQAQQQAGLSQQYQDFQNQQRYPYQQLEFMSNLLRGTPMGTVQTLYQPSPSIGSQLVGLGTAAAGASKLFAEGGLASAYAEGGSVTDERNVASIINKLSDAQLQQAYQMATARQDASQLQLIKRELDERAAMRTARQPQTSGIDTLPTDEMDFAGGGIVAFSDGGDTMFGATPEALAMDELRREEIFKRRRQQADAERMQFLETAAPEVAQRLRTAAPATYPDEVTRRMRSGVAAPAPAGANARAGLGGTPQAAAARAPVAAVAAAPVAPAGLDVGKMVRDALDAAAKQPNQFAEDVRGLGAERVKAKEEEVRGEEAIQKQFADIYKGRKERLDTKEVELGKLKDQGLGLSLLQAGAAMMTTPGGFGVALGKGVRVGTEQYAAGLDKLRSAQEKLSDARDRLEEIEAQRGELSARQLLKLRTEVKTTGISAREDLIKSNMQTYGVNRETALKMVEQQIRVGLSQYEQGEATKRAVIGANATVQAAQTRAAGSGASTAGDKQTLNELKALQTSLKDQLKEPRMLGAAGDGLRRQLADVNAAIAQMAGLSTMATAPGASSPGGTMSGWGTASVVKP